MRNFGPTLTVKNIDGVDHISASCYKCTFNTGSVCTHARPSLKIPDPKNTPDFCEILPQQKQELEELLAKETKQKRRAK